jgi:predicted DNA-binding transcriptional regulator YafY
MRAGGLDPAASWLRSIPSFHVSPTPVRGVATNILRAVISAVEYAHSIEVLYQSMSAPDPTWRWIEPHAYAFDGFRWHVRAFCLKDDVFKDFLLSRMELKMPTGTVTSP